METNNNVAKEEYICKICNKLYKNRDGLWKHNKKHHKDPHVRLAKSSKINENSTENNKYKCKNCKISFETLNDLDIHVKTKCVPCVSHNNVFTFKTNTFGKNKYPKDNGGDIYIVQTEFNLKNFYKIGITINLYSRMKDYRCGAVLEPRIHCYFPIKNIKGADKILKEKLKKYNIKREIYKCENLDEIKQIIKQLQKEFKSEELEVIPEIKECNVCECEYCEEVFTNKYELSIHLNTCKYIKICKDDKNDGYLCNYCNKSFTCYQNRWRHQKSCQYKCENTESLLNENNKLKLIIEKQLEELKEVKSIFANLINKNLEVYPRKLQKINKQLNVDYNTINKNINKGTINNITDNLEIEV